MTSRQAGTSPPPSRACTCWCSETSRRRRSSRSWRPTAAARRGRAAGRSARPARARGGVRRSAAAGNAGATAPGAQCDRRRGHGSDPPGRTGLRVVRINPAGERMLGVNAAAVVGQTCETVLGCDVAGGHARRACPLAEVMAGGAPIVDRQGAVRAAGGEPLAVAGSYYALAIRPRRADPRDGDDPGCSRDSSAGAAARELRGDRQP